MNHLAAFILRVAAQAAWRTRGVHSRGIAATYALDDAASLYEQDAS